MNTSVTLPGLSRHGPRFGLAVAALALWLGWSLPTERYLAPADGLGYALGIAGGGAMLLLLVYPLRKRLRWLGPLGTVRGWFRLHMVLGIVGPILVLYHANFSLGATNSNAALFSMLIVAGSGLFGRYFYGRIHHGLYGRRATRVDLQQAAATLRAQAAHWQLIPDLLDRLDAADARLLAWPPGSLHSPLRPLVVTWRLQRERRRLRRLVATGLLAPAAAANGPAPHEFAVRLLRYVEARLQATRAVAEFEAYERLFSLWHLFHLPLFLMLVLAGTVHVVAVHVY